MANRVGFYCLAALVVLWNALIDASCYALWSIEAYKPVLRSDSFSAHGVCYRGLGNAGYPWRESYSPADSVCKMSKIKLKSSVYSKNGRIGPGIAGDLWWESDSAALAEISLQVRVKKHGQGQRSSGPAGGSGAGNAGGCIGGGGGDEMGIVVHGIGEGRRSGIGGGGQGQGNGDDDDNDSGRIVGNVENGRRPRNPTPEEIALAAAFLHIITQSIANIMRFNDAELSTTGRANRYISMIINLAGFICWTAVLCQYTNPRVARTLNPRISEILSRLGSALAVLGFVSVMGIGLPLYLSSIMGLAFLVILAIFLVDISEARQ